VVERHRRLPFGEAPGRSSIPLAGDRGRNDAAHSLARDDRPWGGGDPPAVAYTYAPGRGGTHAVKLLAGLSGILQVDGYSVYKQPTQPTHEGGAVTLA
jgi:hypothetical protein